MQIQSLSVCVPAGCPNNCKFCVSKMKRKLYKNQIEHSEGFRDLYKKDFKTRLEFARDNGCNTMVLTGDGEPLFNRKFVEDVLEWNEHLSTPFRHIDLQTSGVDLVESGNGPGAPQATLRWLRNAGVTTIALSVSALSNDVNTEYNGTPESKRIWIRQVCEEIKRYDFNLRLSLNMTDYYDSFLSPETGYAWNTLGEFLFHEISCFKPDQVTFRILYESGEETPQDQWIREHKASDEVHAGIIHYIHEHGRKLERLPFGAVRFAVDNMSVVIDDDCMSTAEDKEAIRYLILRPNCKLYSKWNELGSLIF